DRAVTSGRRPAEKKTQPVVALWGVNGELTRRATWDQSTHVTRLAYHPEGRTLALGDATGEVRLCDAASGKALHTLTGHTAAITALAFSGDGGLLATGSADGELRLWDGRTGQSHGPLLGKAGAVTAVALSPKGDALLVARDHGGLNLWYVKKRT